MLTVLIFIYLLNVHPVGNEYEMSELAGDIFIVNLEFYE